MFLFPLHTNQFMNLKIKQVASLLFQSYGWSSIHSFRFCLFWCVLWVLPVVFNCTAYTAAGVARAWYKSIAQHKSILECCRNHCEIAQYRELSIPRAGVFNTQCVYLIHSVHTCVTLAISMYYKAINYAADVSQGPSHQSHQMYFKLKFSIHQLSCLLIADCVKLKFWCYR